MKTLQVLLVGCLMALTMTQAQAQKGEAAATATATAKAAAASKAEVRQPAQQLTLSECQKKTDLEIATEFLDFVANGGLRKSRGSRCEKALKSSLFVPIDLLNGDVVPKTVILGELDKIEITKNQELVNELGFKDHHWVLEYTLHTQSQQIKGELDYYRALDEDDVKNYGCAVLKYQPEVVFIRKSCVIP